LQHEALPEIEFGSSQSSRSSISEVNWNGDLVGRTSHWAGPFAYYHLGGKRCSG